MTAKRWIDLVCLGSGLVLWGPDSRVAAAPSERLPVRPFWEQRFPNEMPLAGEFIVVNAFPDLTFPDPLGVIPVPESDELFVITRQGQVFRFANDPAVAVREQVLDLRANTQGWDDCGMLGLAFHPEFGQPNSANRGFFYVFYQFTENPTGNRETRPAADTETYNRLSRFTILDGERAADPESEQILIHQYDRNLWHNGGGMFFHPTDGFLYLSLGDEGGADAEFGNAQRIDRSLFSGVIRVDVDQDPERSHPIRRQPVAGETAHYFIPNDNPFVDPSGSVLEEFWCVGLREPHRMTIDPETLVVWCGDVGQAAREEVNIIVKAGNYQWGYREGRLLGPTLEPDNPIGVEAPPIHDYPHTSAVGQGGGDNAVIGGHVYRGSEHAEALGGQYIFGDNGSGRIWALTRAEGGSVEVRQIAQMPPGSGYSGLSSFGIDHRNEMYLCQLGERGRIHRLARPPEPSPSNLPPMLLSRTGLFTDLQNLEPAPELIPYRVNAPLFSDHAVKTRWIAIPNDGPPFAEEERAAFDPGGNWGFPAGTVFVKHFELPIDDLDASARHRLETRVLVVDGNDGAYGVTYKWREDGSDADLLLDGAVDEIRVRGNPVDRTVRWQFPSRRDCMACHTPAANFVLGVRTHQLNDPSANQLAAWNQLGMLSDSFDPASIHDLPRAVSILDAAASLSDRSRSYLDANCSQCHRPGGARASFDARFTTPFERQGILGGVVANPLGIDDAVVVAPGAPDRSILLRRLGLVGDRQMPPLGRGLVDVDALRVIDHWVRSLPRPGILRGFRAEYFDGTDLAHLNTVRTDLRVAFDWSGRAPVDGMSQDNYSVRWSGVLLPRHDDEYVFETLSDDGVRLWVDGQLIIDNWTNHAPRFDVGAVTLAAGIPVPIRLEYYQGGGGAVIRLFWSSPSQRLAYVTSSHVTSSTPAFPEVLPPYIISTRTGTGTGGVRFQINLEQAGHYTLEESGDLKSWSPVRDFEHGRGVLHLDHPADPPARQRFFRVSTGIE